MKTQYFFMRPEIRGQPDAGLKIPHIPYQVAELAVAATEAFIVLTAGIAGDFIFHRFWHGQEATSGIPAAIGTLAGLIYLTLARSAKLYQIQALLNPARHAGKVLGTALLSLIALTAILFLLKEGAQVSRGSFVCFMFLEVPLLLVTRYAAAKVLTRLVGNGVVGGRPVVTIGEAPELARLNAQTLLASGLNEVARFTLDQGEDFARTDGQTPLNKAISESRLRHAKEFVLAAAWAHTTLLTEVTEALRISPLPVRLLPDHVIRSALQRDANFATGPLFSVELQRAPLSYPERIVKRVVDFCLSLVGIIILLPLLIATAIVIKLDSKGPIIFRQRRAGFDEHQFVIYKFRTMHVVEDGDAIIQACRHDSRVTRVGKVLRATSIDELPQLINVLKGDMSLVGPRPHALAHDDQYKKRVESYCFRHHVKPGITGWAQVNGLRGETRRLEDMHRRVEYDLWYINNWSFGLDLLILIRTLLEVLRANAF